jgi:hypothetical protein
MPIRTQQECSIWMIPAEVRNGNVIVNGFAPEALLFEVCAPYTVCRGHIMQIEAVNAQPQENLVPGLPGGFADGPDGAITDTDPVRVGVELSEVVTFHLHTSSPPP